MHTSRLRRSRAHKRVRERGERSTARRLDLGAEIRLSLDRRRDLVLLENLTRSCARHGCFWSLIIAARDSLALILPAAARTSLSAAVTPEKGPRVGTLRRRIIPSNHLQGSHASTQPCTQLWRSWTPIKMPRDGSGAYPARFRRVRGPESAPPCDESNLCAVSPTKASYSELADL